MNYNKEIDKVLEEALRDSWMTDEDWDLIITLMHKHPDFNLEKLNREIEVGINNGYSVEFQLDLCKQVLKQLKANDELFNQNCL